MPQAGAENEPPGAAEQIGRPEGGTSGAPIPSPSHPEPKPPELPNPNPGEPDPIPKKLLILPAHPATHNVKGHAAKTAAKAEEQEMPGPTSVPAVTPHVAPPPI